MSLNNSTNDRFDSNSQRTKNRRGDLQRVELTTKIEPAPHRANQTLRTIVPSLLVALGGAGGQVLSRLKKYLEDQGTDSYTRCVVIDTDENAQAGAEGCPSFSDEEFVWVKTQRVQNIVQNPKSHRVIIERLGLNSADKLAFHERLINEGIEQAGQVRPFGSMAFESNYTAVQSALRNGISFLNGAHSDLEKQLESDNRVVIRRHMTVYVLFSNAGGTGSSMAIETMAMLREMTKQLSVEIVGVMVMPSAFDSVMAGRPEQEVRIRANAFATMQELNAFREGIGASYGVKLGPDERNGLVVPAGLFNQLFVVGRYMADGRDLRTPEAVIDTAALSLAAEIGTEIGDRIEADDANQATLRSLTPDPMTGKARDLSTFSATALALPAERIARSCSARSAYEFVRARALGKETDPGSMDQYVETWIAQPLAGEPVELKAASLATLLRRSVVPNPNVLTRGLYQVVSGTQRVHYKDSVFPQHFNRLTQNFKETLLPGFEAKLSDYSSDLIDDLTSALDTQVEKLTRDAGWRATESFCRSLIQLFESTTEVLATESDADSERAKASFMRAKEFLTPMLTFFGSFGTSRKKQNLVAEHLQTAMVAALDGEAKLLAQRVLHALSGQVGKHLRVAEDAIEGASRCLSQAQAAYDDARAGRRVTTNSEAEIDVSTPATDQELFNAYRLDNATILERLSASLGASPSQALRMVATDPAIFASLMEKLRFHFLDRFEGVSVVDVLADQLADPQTEQKAQARIRSAVQGCQPLWRAESGQVGVEFADTMIVGLPESSVSIKRERVADALMEAATHRIHPNGQYNGSATQVTSGDVHRIYVIRRTHGGCLHYLPEVIECQSAFDQWTRTGGHPVHIFNSDTVLRMPAIIPNSDMAEGEMAFSLALAYGWIANRGPHWYWNLATGDVDSGRLVSRLISHWDGVAFHGQRLAIKDGALATFVGTGRLAYEGRDDMVPADKLGQGMDNAVRTFCRNEKMTGLVSATFDDMRAAAGDVRVADELEGYIVSLKSRIRSSDQNFELTMRMIGVLSHQLTELRRN